MQTKQIIRCALFGTITFSAKFALAPLPNIEPVTLLLSLFVITLGLRQAFAIQCVYIALEIFIYGFSIWAIGYLYIWSILLLLTSLVWRTRSIAAITLSNAFFGLAFGSLYYPLYCCLYGSEAAIAWIIAGIPFDVIHCIGNFVISVITLRPLVKIFQKKMEEK